MAAAYVRRYELIGRNWSRFSPAQSTDLASAFSNQQLRGPSGSRYGMQRCESAESGDIGVVGIFVQEIPRQRDALTDTKALRRTSEPHAKTFAFAMLPNEGYIALQSRRMSQESAELVLSRFAEVLRDGLASIGFTFEALSLIEEGVSRQEFVTAFFSVDTQRVTMVDLRDFSIAPPSDFLFFNPKYDLNPIMSISNEYDRRMLKSARLESNTQGNLKLLPTARGLMVSSADPRRIEIETQHGPQVLERTRSGKLPLTITGKALRALTGPAILALLAVAGGRPHAVTAPRGRRRGSQAAPKQQQSLFPPEDV